MVEAHSQAATPPSRSSAITRTCTSTLLGSLSSVVHRVTLDLLGEKSSLIPTEVGVRMVEAHSQARILPRLTGLLPIFAGRWLSLSSRAAFANARSSSCPMPSALRNLYPTKVDRS